MSNVKRIRANRHFDQLRAGEELVVDVTDGYWANQILAGNVAVVDEQPAAPEPEVEDLVLDEEIDFGLEEEVFPEGDPED